MLTRDDFGHVCAFDEIVGEDEEETQALRKDADRCDKFIKRQLICDQVFESYFGLGISEIVSVCLFKMRYSESESIEWVWGYVGKLPSAIIGAEYKGKPFLKNAPMALDSYIGSMMHWVEAARNGDPVDDLIQVNVDPTPEWADELEWRLEFLYKKYLQVEYPEYLVTNPEDYNFGSYFFHE